MFAGLAGIFGKVKGDTLQLAAVLQVLMLALEEDQGYEIFDHDEGDREEKLTISTLAMESAIKLVQNLLEQRVVFEGDFDLMSACSEFWDWNLPGLDNDEEKEGGHPNVIPMVSKRTGWNFM